MANLNGFDASKVEPSTGFDPIPAGKYNAVISDSEMKPTKDGTGEYLQLEFQVLDGEFKGRKLWSRLNLRNNSNQAVEIARAELSAICRAVGVITPNDSCELHDLPLVIKVALKKRDDTGETTNEIKGYEGRMQQQQSKPANGREPAMAGAPATAPWKR